MPTVIFSGMLSPARAAKLHLLDYEAENSPGVPFLKPVCNAKLHGTIRPGDSERIEAVLELFKQHPAVAAVAEREGSYHALCLSSPGGDLVEALKIATLFRGWMVVIDAGDQCISACAILFMRTPRIDFIYEPDEYRQSTSRGRYLHVNGRLGFHAPRLQMPQGAGSTLTPDQAAEQYARALKTVQAVLIDEHLEEHLVNVTPVVKLPLEITFVGKGNTTSKDMPLDLVIAFLTTPPDEVYWITTVNEAMHWGIEIYGFPPPRKLTAKMLMTACINVAGLRCSHSSGGDQCPQSFDEYSTDGSSTADRERGQGATALDEIAADWTPARLSLWPKPGVKDGITIEELTVEAFRVSIAKQYKEVHNGQRPCVIRATWKGAQLYELEIQTFNGHEKGWLGANLSMDAEEAWRILENLGTDTDGRCQLRPWKMLPAGTLLSELAGEKPWGWLEEGGDFFTKPPGW